MYNTRRLRNVKIKITFKMTPKERANFVPLIQSQPRKSIKEIVESAINSCLSFDLANHGTDEE